MCGLDTPSNNTRSYSTTGVEMTLQKEASSLFYGF